MLLVTGITGHSGKYFLQELINHKYEDTIRCVVRSSSDTSLLDNSGLKIEKVVGDLKDQGFMDSCMKDVDTVMHIGTIFNSVTVINSAVKNNVRNAILVHTTGIYSKFKSASEEYKCIEDKLEKNITRGTQLNITILRPTMIYGDMCDQNMSKFIKMVYKLRLFPVVNHGNGLIQPVNARDLGKAYYQVLVMPESIRRKEYILSGERPIELIKALRTISDCLNRRTVFISFPLQSGVLLARILKAVTLGKVDYIEKVQRMGENRSFPHDDAKNDFGYNPRTFDEGISIEVDQYINR
jgi:nucleoside-diphosphate-sugar epimerase